MYGQNHGNVPSANAPQGAQGSFGNGNNNSGASSATGKYFGAAAPVLPFEKANGQHGTEFSQTRKQIGETPAGNFGGSFNQMQQYASPFAHAKILRFDNNPHAGDGSYNYAYETDNGIAVQEEGFLRDGSQVAQGGYMYTAPDGQQYSVEYIADENGFQPKSAQWAGRDAILRSIQLNKEAEARGEYNEGSYHEEEGAEQKDQFGAHQNGAGSTRFSGDQNAPQSGFGPGASQQNGYQRGPLGPDQAGGANANGNSYNYPQPNSVSSVSKAGQTFNGPQPTQHGAVTSLKHTQNGKNGYGAVQNSISSDKKPDQPSSGPQQLKPYDQSAQPQSGFAPQSQGSFFPSQHQPGAPVGHQAPFQENGHQQGADLQQDDNNQFPPISKSAGGAPQQQVTSPDKQYDINGGYKY
ncbi:unnamed protein product [Acanthoscelides obtectus]|nr:unnamed protein product [Acanthoscelides obtectus]CAK1631036.1 hypothetical protein AOBTE_LOCUS6718 [Acanthoscelides obtectus]